MSREFKAFLLSFGLHAMIFMAFFSVSRTMVTYSRPILIDFSIEETALPVKKEIKKSLSKEEKTLKKEIGLKTNKEINTPQPLIPNNQTPVRDIPEEQSTPKNLEVAENSPQAIPAVEPHGSFTENDLTGEVANRRTGEAGKSHSPIHPFTHSSGSSDSPERARQRYLKEHFAYIRDIITKNLSYPYMARKMGWEGRVTVSFVVSEDGSASDIKIIESSGFDLLDKNAVDTVRKVSPFPRPPVRAEVVVPVVYRLN